MCFLLRFLQESALLTFASCPWLSTCFNVWMCHFFLLGIETIQWIQASDMQVQILQKLSMNPQQAADHSWKPVGEWSCWFQGIPCTDQSLCSSGACGPCSYRGDQDQHCAYKICSQEDSETVPKTFTFIALFLKSSIPVNSQDFTVSDFFKAFLE